MMTLLTPDDDPSIWTHLKNVPLLVVVSFLIAVSALFSAFVADCGVLSVTLELCCIQPSLEIAETMVGFASRVLHYY